MQPADPRHTRQRRHPRIETRRAVLVQEIGFPVEETIAVTRTLGLGGCMISHPYALGSGALVHVWLALRDHVIHTEGAVVWERSAGDGWEIGLQFLRLTASDREALQSLVVH